MTPEQINVAIEEVCGGPVYGLKKQGYWYRPGASGYTAQMSEAWRLPLEKAKKYEYLHGDSSDQVRVCRFPPKNYCGDLNAMHEAEKALDKGQQFEYHNHLFDLLPCDENHGSPDGDLPDVMTPSGFTMINAPAPQRSEAFLRTIGKWVES